MIKYPYTDFHEMNLDWILNEVKNAIKNIKNISSDVNSLEHSVTELKTYIDYRFDNLEIAEAVNSVIDSMYADGTLAELINTFNPMPISIQRIFRVETLKTAALYNQALTYDGTNFILAGSIDNETQYFAEVSTSGEIIRTHTFNAPTELGHINSIAYLDGYIYTVNGVTNANICRINTSTWNIEDTRSIIGSTYNNIWAVASYNNDIYYCASLNADVSKAHVIKYDWAAETINIICEFSLPSSNSTFSATRQGCTIAGGILYLSYSGNNQIVKIPLSYGGISAIYEVPIGDGYFPVGEIEDMTTVNDQVFFLSSWARQITNTFNYSYANIFKTNIGGFVSPVGLTNVRDSRYALIVDDNNTVKNPNGTSDAPFNHAEEACYVYEYLFKHNPSLSVGNITLNSGGGCITLCGVNCSITGNGNTISNIYLFDGRYFIVNVITSDAPFNRLYNVSGTMQSVTFDGSNIFTGSNLTLANCVVSGSLQLQRTTATLNGTTEDNMVGPTGNQFRILGLKNITANVAIPNDSESATINVPISHFANMRYYGRNIFKILISFNDVIYEVPFVATDAQIANLYSSGTDFSTYSGVITDTGLITITANLHAQSNNRIPITFSASATGANVVRIVLD